jgi:hypothetical protein
VNIHEFFSHGLYKVSFTVGICHLRLHLLLGSRLPMTMGALRLVSGP